MESVASIKNGRSILLVAVAAASQFSPWFSSPKTSPVDFDFSPLHFLSLRMAQHQASAKTGFLELVPFFVVLLLAAHVLALVPFHSSFFCIAISFFLSLTCLIFSSGVLDLQISNWKTTTISWKNQKTLILIQSPSFCIVSSVANPNIWLILCFYAISWRN